ncbi:MAG: hypothetical protein KF773_39970 [Deltaproteobacteria bacterium]|nr:hypothetical protein [Deltaproteobacteria bacterium]MCW5808749.1 hypothetical protein [Deltaproteobacteria bacterium]
MTERLSPENEARFWEHLAATEEFFMGTAPVHEATRRITKILEEMSLPYALIGAMALNEYGFERATVDVDILLTEDSLRAFKAAWLGRGYVEKFPGSRGVRDAELGVSIDFVIAGHYPGDGKPKPVRFPDPALVVQRGGRVALLPIARMIELKLASGMSSLDRAKDLGDAVELIRHVKLPRELADELDPSVRGKYLEAWDAVQNAVSMD